MARARYIAMVVVAVIAVAFAATAILFVVYYETSYHDDEDEVMVTTQVRDINGVPIPDCSVSRSLLNGREDGELPILNAIYTDENGQLTQQFVPRLWRISVNCPSGQRDYGASYRQAQITASVGQETETIVITVE